MREAEMAVAGGEMRVSVDGLSTVNPGQANGVRPTKWQMWALSTWQVPKRLRKI
jgi:hypothetical protein